jgi:hypothetical protein
MNSLAVLLLLALPVAADLGPGAMVPNPTLRSSDGVEATLHSMLKRVTVIHLWKCE